MNRILPILSMILILAGFQQKGSAQTITGVYYNDSCYYTGGTYVSSYVSITGPSTTSTCKVESNNGDGSALDTNMVYGSGTSYNTYSNHLYTVGGTYTIKHVLICAGSRVDSVSNSIAVTCRYIYGVLYNDLNSNCIPNAAEPGLGSVAQIQVDSAGVLIDTLYAYNYWAYRIRATTTTTYRFSIIGNPVGYTKSCPTSGIITHTFNPASATIPNQNFGFNCSSTPAYDYRLSYNRILRAASSGLGSHIGLFASNSTCSAGTGTVTLNVSPKYNVNSGITPTPTSVSGNTVTWTIANMANGRNTYLYIPLTPKSTTNIGDTACNYAIITPTAGDINTANNVISVCDSVRSSWDPNEKSVDPIGPVSAGTTVTYTINFENLGNDTALNIHVQDTLSPFLDANTFSLVNATHMITPYVYQTSTGAPVIKFDFPNIKLGDKTDLGNNKGQVKFSMKVKTGTVPGYIVSNSAGIYFDGNPVVQTNYVHTTVLSPEGANPLPPQNTVNVFPNPAHNELTIQASGNTWTEANLSNALGQSISKTNIYPGANMLSIQSLPAGIYYLQIKGTEGVITKKIEKQ